MNTGTKKPIQFYLGKSGAIIPIATMFLGIMVLVALGYSSAKTFWAAALLSLIVAFALSKNKTSFNDTVIDGLRNPLLAVMTLAFYMAGIIAQLLKDGGLVDGLLWASAQLNVGPELIPVITFFICVIISLCTGTTGGTVTAITPVMLPLAVALGCDPALMMGAIISGSFFGDNLAPVSDTTIASAYTQETEVPLVVKSRVKYSVIAGSGAAVLFTIFGFTTSVVASNNLNMDPSAAKGLILLLAPVALIIFMIRGYKLVPAMMGAITVTIAISLITGLTTVQKLIEPGGTIISGIEGMVFLTVFCVFIFALISIMTSAGVFTAIIDRMSHRIKSPRQAEFLGAGMAGVFTMLTAASTVAIVVCGPVLRAVFKRFHLGRERGANILDGISCGVAGLCFWNLSCLAAYTLAVNTGAVGENFSIMSAIPYTFHNMLLIVVYIVAIITGFGRTFESSSDVEATDTTDTIDDLISHSPEKI